MRSPGKWGGQAASLCPFLWGAPRGPHLGLTSTPSGLSCPAAPTPLGAPSRILSCSPSPPADLGPPTPQGCPPGCPPTGTLPSDPSRALNVAHCPPGPCSRLRHAGPGWGDRVAAAPRLRWGTRHRGQCPRVGSTGSVPFCRASLSRARTLTSAPALRPPGRPPCTRPPGHQQPLPATSSAQGLSLRGQCLAPE